MSSDNPNIKKTSSKATSGGNEGTIQKKTTLFSDLRKKSKLFRGPALGNKMKGQVSRSKGNLIRIMKKRFPAKIRPEKSEDNLGSSFPKAKPPLYPQLRESWLSVEPKHIAKDLHRLIYRITVKTSGQRDILMSPPAKEDRQGVRKAAETVVQLIKLLAKRMLDAEESQRVHDVCDEVIVGVDEKTDLIKFNMDLFKGMSEENQIIKVLRCVHQSLVLKPYGILRTVMIKDKLTKDVRGDEGWQVEITVAHEGFIQVVHVRKEQSVDFPTKNQRDAKQNHWEYQWEVSMTFDGKMEDMTQSRLSITNLVLNEGMDPDLEKELRAIMQDGSLIVF